METKHCFHLQRTRFRDLDFRIPPMRLIQGGDLIQHNLAATFVAG
jgi:hypothetical protein